MYHDFRKETLIRFWRENRVTMLLSNLPLDASGEEKYEKDDPADKRSVRLTGYGEIRP